MTPAMKSTDKIIIQPLTTPFVEEPQQPGPAVAVTEVRICSSIPQPNMPNCSACSVSCFPVLLKLSTNLLGNVKTNSAPCNDKDSRLPLNKDQHV